MNKSAILLFCLIAFTNQAWGQLLRYSVDTGTSLTAKAIHHGNIVFDPQTGTVSVSDPLMLPPGVDLTGLESGSGNTLLFSIDTTALLSGTVISRSDVGQFSGGDYTVVFDGSSNGVPPSAAIDAFTIDGDDLLLSFDISVDFQAFVAHDEDLVRFDGANFTLELDLSAEGLPENLDLEAVHRLDDGTYFLSFTENGIAGGVSFADEDILGLDPSDSSWTMVFDGSAAHAGLANVAVDALSLASIEIFRDSFEDLVVMVPAPRFELGTY